MGTIEIKCKGSRTLDILELNILQGNLKELPEENYLKLKARILELGYSEPVSVWFSDNRWWLLNGTQRYRTLNRMREEGIVIPEIPVSEIQAENLIDAKRKILSLTSQFGEMTEQGLYEFIEESGIPFTEVMTDYRFNDIDQDKFIVSFYGDSSQMAANGAQELSHGQFSEFTNVCPRCGFHFDKSKNEVESNETHMPEVET